MSVPQYAVLIEGQAAFGPFADEEEAREFAKFATEEIDPAQVVTLNSPVDELLRWRKAEREWRELNDG